MIIQQNNLGVRCSGIHLPSAMNTTREQKGVEKVQSRTNTTAFRPAIVVTGYSQY